MKQKLLSLYSLKFHPFRPDVPIDALYTLSDVDIFCRRVEFAINDGGFVMITGEPGTGKSVAVRILAHRLSAQRDVVVGCIDHPQSRVSDFYRELGDIFGVVFSNQSEDKGGALLCPGVSFCARAQGSFIPCRYRTRSTSAPRAHWPSRQRVSVSRMVLDGPSLGTPRCSRIAASHRPPSPPGGGSCSP